jgi:Cu-processing system permease protein
MTWRGGGVLLLCAESELAIAVRSRWTRIFATVFAAIALAVAASGYVLSGGHGVQDFARTSASLLDLVLLLVPVAAILLGVLALAPERGASELLFAQPVRRTAVLIGKAMGLFAALAAAQAIGFGLAGVVIFASAGGDGLSGYLLLFAGSLVLTAIFVGLAALIAAGPVGRRARALAVGLVVWFVIVVLFDVVALGVASVLPSGTASRLLIVAVIANPIDAVRTGVLLATQGTAAFGAASLAFFRFVRGPLGAVVGLSLSLAVWLVVPAVLAARRLARTDL